MFNIFKMDLYKIFKSKSFYVMMIALLIVVLGFSTLLRITLSMDYSEGKDSSLSLQTENSNIKTNDRGITEEEYYAVIEEIKDSMGIGEFINFQYGSPIIGILLSIFIAIFVCSESETGFIKNLIPIRNSRINLVLSKILVILIFIIIQAAVAVLASIAANLIVVGKIGEIPYEEIMKYMGFQMMLLMAFGALMTLISYLFRSKAITMTIGILLSVNIHGQLLGMLDKIINASKIKLAELSIIGSRGLIGRDELVSLANCKSIIIISIIYFVLYNVISIIRVKKMEVN